MTFVIKDSGARKEYASGLRRDTQEGKPDFTLVPLHMLKRWATHMTKGAVKYGRENWKLAGGNPDSAQEELDRFKSSAFRHFVQWLDGDRDEDHACAVFFNIAVAEYIQTRITNQDFEVDTLYALAKELLDIDNEANALYASVKANPGNAHIAKEGAASYDEAGRCVTTDKLGSWTHMRVKPPKLPDPPKTLTSYFGDPGDEHRGS